MKKETWVVVANSAEARIFKVEKNALDHEMVAMVHPNSRLHDRDLTNARPGRAFDRVGAGRHSLEPQTQAKAHEFMLFAKDVAAYLDAACAAGKLGRFYLAANPSFLGLLRQSIGNETLKLLAGEVTKDLVQAEPADIREYFPPVL
jgi:protein required for attachment to host cells